MTKQTILQNTKWLILCRILQLGIQLVTGMLSARYLGPEGYGLLGYAASLTAFVLPLMQLGFRSTLVREYVAAPDRQGNIMGTALVLNGICALACMAAIAVFSGIAHPDQPQTRTVCMLYSLGLLGQSFALIQYRFQANLQAKYPSLAMLAAYALASGYRLYLLATGKSIYWFALAHGLESGLTAVFLLYLTRKLDAQPLGFSPDLARHLLRQGKYYIFSGLLVTVFQNTDHIMLRLLAGEAANGYYTAAVTCAGCAGFVYQAIVDSFRPVLLSAHSQDTARFDALLSRVYSLMIYLSLAQSLLITALARPMVTLLYGQAYGPAVGVLRILVWYLAFSHMGTVRNIWILANGQQHILWRINLSGAVMNILLNALMIPLWGAWGGALASLLTQIISNFLMSFLPPALRPHTRLLVAGLNPRRAREAVAQMFS